MTAVETSTAATRRRRILVLLPLLLFMALAALFLYRLGAGDPSRLPSALIGRPVPANIRASSRHATTLAAITSS